MLQGHNFICCYIPCLPYNAICTLVESVKKTNRVVIVHEAHRRAGPGAEIAALLLQQMPGERPEIPAPVELLGAEGNFVEDVLVEDLLLRQQRLRQIVEQLLDS